MCRTVCASTIDKIPPTFITHYSVQITPNFSDQSIEGFTELKVDLDAQTRSFFITINDLVLDEVSSDSKDLKWKQVEKVLELTFSVVPKKLLIRYHGKSLKGLVWGNNFVYSAYFTCHWMICDPDPGHKAKFDIKITVPSDFKTTASGNFEGIEKSVSGLTSFKWHEEKPYSSYVFGFATGKFHEAQLNVRGKVLRLLGVQDDEKSLMIKFHDTIKALEFFEDKAGVPLQHSTYTQVLVPESVAQENNAFAVIGKIELDPI